MHQVYVKFQGHKKYGYSVFLRIFCNKKRLVTFQIGSSTTIQAARLSRSNDSNLHMDLFLRNEIEFKHVCILHFSEFSYL